MDNSFFDIFHQARRILCQCPECGELSRLSEIHIKSGKKSKPTWLDAHQENEDGFIAASDKFEEKKAELKKKATDKGRLQAEKDMRDLIKNSLLPSYQKMSYDPRDIIQIWKSSNTFLSILDFNFSVCQFMITVDPTY